ncbi:MAG: DUF1684 domain-containing protein [Burkholderiales bacterium]
MSSPAHPLELAVWRRTVAAHYKAVREATGDPAAAAARFRREKDDLFRAHSESPIAPERRAAWPGLAWYDHDPQWRVVGAMTPTRERETFEISLLADGLLRCTRVGHVAFTVAGHAASLALYWLEGYGGGLWLPFGDATNGTTTYGGGRYLYDTIKGADLGVRANDVVLDFNYAYNPSCAYDDRWSCPLAPPENRLPFAVTAGERVASSR